MYPNSEPIEFKVCIVIAMDREGHIVNKTAGRGRITANEIDKAIGSHLSHDIILCTDHATNYKNFAMNRCLEHKTLNASKKQRVVEKVYHIQHVNSYHSRLEDWINCRFKGFATKYMDKNKREKLLTTMFKPDKATTVKLLRPA